MELHKTPYLGSVVLRDELNPNPIAIPDVASTTRFYVCSRVLTRGSIPVSRVIALRDGLSFKTS